LARTVTTATTTRTRTTMTGSSGCNRTTSLIEPAVKLEGEVTKGFGRGSREIGCPTANFDEKVVDQLFEEKDFETGIYFGWVVIGSQPHDVRKAVVSIGWNPYYNNSKKSVETHIIHEYSENFYGDWLKLLICGYIRPELNFNSLDELIEAIKADVKHADQALDQDVFKEFRNSDFFAQKN